MTSSDSMRWRSMTTTPGRSSVRLHRHRVRAGVGHTCVCKLQVYGYSLTCLILFLDLKELMADSAYCCTGVPSDRAAAGAKPPAAAHSTAPTAATLAIVAPVL